MSANDYTDLLYRPELTWDQIPGAMLVEHWSAPRIKCRQSSTENEGILLNWGAPLTEWAAKAGFRRLTIQALDVLSPPKCNVNPF